jgi:DNA-binding transcriptional regulator YhcF (GntR family)
LRNTPLWAAIARSLREDIAEGRYAPGDKLPTEAVLSERHGVNRHTVRHALAALVDEGLVRTRRGAGAFVAGRPADYPKKTHEFFWSMMSCKADYADYSSSISQDGLNWGRRHYGRFLEHSMSTICNLRLVASADPARILPTAKLMRDFVHSSLVPAARKGRCLLLVMRSPRDWGFGSPETDSWDNGLFVSRSLRTASITPTSRVGPAIQEWLTRPVE